MENNKDQYVNHSGGAVGADYEWGRQGEPYGVISRHYWHYHRTPYGNMEITEADFDEGIQHVLQANLKLHRRPGRYLDLLARDWCQVKYADAVFAIGQIKQGVVAGGTGWAVQMAIDEGKPVYLFDQKIDKWLHYSNGVWTFCPSPTLTLNFAGIGSRNITENGIRAIGKVYCNTFGKNKSIQLTT